MNKNYSKDVIIELLKTLLKKDFNNFAYYDENVEGYKIEILDQPKDCKDFIIPNDSPNGYTLKFSDNTFSDISVPVSKNIYITNKFDTVTTITLAQEILHDDTNLHKIGFNTIVKKRFLLVPYKKTKLYYLLRYPKINFIEIKIDNLKVVKYELTLEEFNRLMNFYHIRKDEYNEYINLNSTIEIFENITTALNKYEITNRNII